MKNKTLEERVVALEAESYRNTRRFADVDDEFGLLRGAVDELSADLREHRLETKEQVAGVNQRLDGIDGRLDGIDTRLDNIDRRFDGVDGRLDSMDRRFDGIDGRLDGMDGLLRQILAVVTPATPEVVRQHVGAPTG
ncbi:hypothetical protein [Catellatospora citrea]|uniref:t-SNARE coiled-coil homology domain-containing protein n=1 Tax=Catellatospora citrea TaxID=53366 RepID=A0A8J3NY46_9ACTN|nr:hypothetical protein [Catellatospora citrea]RKE12397.1 hypothetical protein C8E86_7339 [Catellatospora citrea]GIF96371.1 hypothetical protein Cci01nite_14650 [Catellatospora citrea]